MKIFCSWLISFFFDVLGSQLVIVCWKPSYKGGRVRVLGLNWNSENILVHEQCWQGIVLLPCLPSSLTEKIPLPTPKAPTHSVIWSQPNSSVSWPGPSLRSFHGWIDEALLENHSPLSFLKFLPEMTRRLPWAPALPVLVLSFCLKISVYKPGICNYPVASASLMLLAVSVSLGCHSEIPWMGSLNNR